MTRAVLGLDIGGANLKAAHTSGTARTVPFPLWKHPERLTEKLRSLIAAMPAHERLAVTMTGELCDCYASKLEGVQAILRSVADAADRTPVRVWTVEGNFVSIAEANVRPRTVAAANWLALAHLAARQAGDRPGLLLDTGSTTTDIVFVEDGTPRPRGLTDRERLATGELIYTGIRRTPVCAVLGMRVAAELFATMLDAYLVLGKVPGRDDDHDTADGRPATMSCARARLVRMLCADCAELGVDELVELARDAVTTQVNAVADAVERVLDGRPSPQCVILAGSGEVLGREVLASRAALAAVEVIALSKALGPALSEAAAAYAVAVLAGEE